MPGALSSGWWRICWVEWWGYAVHCVAALLRIATHRAAGAVMAGALQLTDNYKVATPANWQDGDEVVIVPSLKDEAEIAQRFPQG